MISSLVIVALFAITVIVARRNLIGGRADVRGAVRLSTVIGTLSFFGWGLFSAPQNSMPGWLLQVGAAMTVFFALFHATCYLALEPIVRRRNPVWLASWTRLLEGRWLDPLVGRHLLFGIVVGILLAVASGARGYWSHSPAIGDFQAAAVGGWTALGVVLRAVDAGVLGALFMALMIVILQLAIRRDRIAWVAWLAITALIFGTTTGGEIWIRLVQAAVLGAVLSQLGVLPVVVAYSVFAMLNEEYLTTHLGAWYSGVTVAALLTITALTLWASIAALRGTRGAQRA
jgi:hypothetical protein